MKRCTCCLPVVIALVLGSGAVSADTLELRDGPTINNCFVRDEAVRYLVWEKWEDVGTPKMRVVPASNVKKWTKSRDEATWNAHPNLPDLSVTFIEINPKLAGLHGVINYDDKTGRPIPKGAKTMVDVGDRVWMEPEDVVKNIKLKYQPGEELTLTAHVKNVGFTPAATFGYVWLIDGKEVQKGTCDKALKEMEETTFTLKYKWEDGQHTVTFKLVTDQKEISTLNNEVSDALWAYSFSYVVSNGKDRVWHSVRSAVGSFSFEDYYRWHVDLMNTIFAASIWPSAPQGIKARVRLDRIVYCDGNPEDAQKALTQPDGMRYDQGNWTWGDKPEETKSGKFELPTFDWYTGTEWSLPHELGHQLGIADWYWIDYEGTNDHVWPDNGEKVSHFELHPNQMMHWHGPNLYGEVDAGYFNMTWDKPRGYFADYYFAIPTDNFIRVVDVNGIGVPSIQVEIFQRGAVVDPKGQPAEDQGVKYFPIVEDGDFEKLVSKDPVIIGATDADGLMHLPNRPVAAVKTLNGFERHPSPFGNINVMGNRGELLVKVMKDNRPAYFMLEIYDYNVAWFRGHKDRFTMVLKTPFGSVSSPPRPEGVTATPFRPAEIGDPHTPVERFYTSGDDQRNWRVKVTWRAPHGHEKSYLDRVIGFRVYRRVGSMTLNDRPWFPVATLGSDATEFILNMKDLPEDTYWYSGTNRFAVTTIGELGMESELVEAPIPALKKP